MSSGQLLWLAGAGVAVAVLAFLSRVVAPNLIDRPVSLAINALARVSPVFDFAVGLADRYALFQGVFILALGMGAYVSVPGAQRLELGAGGIGAAAAALFSRGVQVGMPHVPRPMFDPALAFTAPLDANTTALADWSSFPSDHAALLFGLSVAVFLTHRWLGLLAIATAGLMGFTRAYQGEHYLSDVLGGAALGLAGACAAVLLARIRTPALLAGIERHRVLLTVVGTLFFVEAAQLFEDVRHIGVAVAKLLQSGG